MGRMNLCLLFLLLCPQRLQEYLMQSSKVEYCAKPFTKNTVVITNGDKHCVPLHTSPCLSNLPVLLFLGFQSISKSFPYDFPLAMQQPAEEIEMDMAIHKTHPHGVMLLHINMLLTCRSTTELVPLGKQQQLSIPMFPSELDPGKPRSNCQQFQAGRTETNSRQLAPLTTLSSTRKSQLVFLYAQVLLELWVAKD